jgi:hypothetical protein
MVTAGVLPALESWYSPYPAPLVQLAVGVMLVRRFAGALTVSEALVESLEETVRRKRAELELGYERIREMDRSRLLSDERQRIMRDVQDGLGSHLVSTLALTERTDVDRRVVAGAIRSALDDLRLMIDSLRPVEGDILPVLGQLRWPSAPRAENRRRRNSDGVAGRGRAPDPGPRTASGIADPPRPARGDRRHRRATARAYHDRPDGRGDGPRRAPRGLRRGER